MTIKREGVTYMQAITSPVIQSDRAVAFSVRGDSREIGKVIDYAKRRGIP
eukprot:CAMPEP_0184654558 /NCGR_PEP_ID=MMETSP0308-20130426/12223_1 /TAXON_ID=38269 /ORGANISM="Gloeochaete witrockiana, Strain SAG 46.84" /LENGTH=49 /DNA_ID= /DNA_START= /DNA_END= /DNA_ORIENTATION=